MILGDCARCGKPVEYDEQGYWTTPNGKELLMHGDCVIEAWVNEEKFDG